MLFRSIVANTRAEQGNKVRLIGHKKGIHRGAKCVMNSMLEPGMIVRHPDRPEWGLGQVQSNIGERITVNFENVGKVVIAGQHITLVQVFDSSR